MIGDSTRTMAARKDSKCPACKKQITAGEKIASKNRGRWVHASCSITWLCDGRTIPGSQGVALYIAMDANGKRVGDNAEGVLDAIQNYAPVR